MRAAERKSMCRISSSEDAAPLGRSGCLYPRVLQMDVAQALWLLSPTNPDISLGWEPKAQLASAGFTDSFLPTAPHPTPSSSNPPDSIRSHLTPSQFLGRPVPPALLQTTAPSPALVQHTAAGTQLQTHSCRHTHTTHSSRYLQLWRNAAAGSVGGNSTVWSSCDHAVLQGSVQRTDPRWDPFTPAVFLCWVLHPEAFLPAQDCCKT